MVDSPFGERYLVAVVSDGAGSAPRSHDGSRLACHHFSSLSQAFLRDGGRLADLSHAQIASWIDRFQAHIDLEADAAGAVRRDFACTLLGAVVGSHAAVFFQIGDGAIVMAETLSPDIYHLPFWPDEGLYVNTTFFATESDAATRLKYEYVERSLSEVALFTDGIERLGLHFETCTAHDPFFRGVFGPLRAASGAGHADAVSAALASFLGSDRINAKTDDDKTLVLATRWTRP